MDVTQWIQAAVVRLDMAVCAAGPLVAVTAVIMGMVWVALWIARK